MSGSIAQGGNTDVHIQRIESEVKELGHNVDRLCSSNSELVQEMRQMTATLTKHMIDNKEHAVNIEHLREGQNEVSKRVRRLEDEQCPAARKTIQELTSDISAMGVAVKPLPGKVEALEEWQSNIKGGLLTIPALCAAISAIAALVSFIFSLGHMK